MPSLTLASPLFLLLPEHERAAANAPRSVLLTSTSWGDLTREVRQRFPELAARIFSTASALERGFVLVLNDDVLHNGEIPDPLAPNDRLYLIAQIAGG